MLSVHITVIILYLWYFVESMICLLFVGFTLWSTFEPNRKKALYKSLLLLLNHYYYISYVRRQRQLSHASSSSSPTQWMKIYGLHRHYLCHFCTIDPLIIYFQRCILKSVFYFQWFNLEFMFLFSAAHDGIIDKHVSSPSPRWCMHVDVDFMSMLML